MRTGMRSRIIASLLLALILIITTTGCGTIRNIFGRHGTDAKAQAALAEYVAANQSYTADMITYTAARVAIRAARVARQVSDDKWMEFRLAQNAIIAAAPIVDADLATWGATGKKPELYEAHVKTLRDALADAINAAKEFQP